MFVWNRCMYEGMNACMYVDINIKTDGYMYV